ncbi:MAG: hypothetical protein UV60_C0035G0004 [Parcubacteria group bacterium GW2011_GWA2_43_11]|nr:MAG: hypothetical protein UU89_C0030G0004 [Parcubacteria group bacterium GW2011_GWC2_42_11]KKS83685.1 MAG: hypothetical protein UV60_C0035G0004 [Parcubacteria group bacterium GW2011_GWA2_43_11]
MTTQLRTLLFFGILLVVVVVALYLHLAPSGQESLGEVACTEEAMICPDGTGVGRTGALCEFTPCPNQESFTGELIAQGDQYVLSVASPLTGMGEVTYALPLIVSDVTEAEALLGNIVTVTGSFTTGNSLRVTTLSSAENQPNEAGVAQGTLAVGESALIGAVRITFVGVEGDSRCPIDVECIQAGALTVSVTLESDTDTLNTLMMSDQQPLPFDAYEVSIVSVTPEAVSTKVLGAANYRVTFQVSPLPSVDSAFEQYIRVNIASLSPAKTVLGGTFYITSIRQTSDTSAVIQYEDGHIALTADVVFTKTSDGEIKVEEFIIRRGSGF